MRNILLTIGATLLATITLQVHAQENQTKIWDYPIQPGSEKWELLNNATEMRNACQIPDTILTKISTKDLLDICLNHPLINDIYLFNDPKVGYKFFYDHFNGIQEFINRKDCIRVLIEKYIKEKNDRTENKTDINKNPRETKIIEYIFKDNNLAKKATINEKEEIQNILNNINTTTTDTTLLSSHNKAKVAPPTSDIIRYFYVYTPKGTKVRAMIKKEASDFSNDFNDSFYKEEYPNEIFLSKSSNRYNCDAYAWHMTDGHPNDTCWIGYNIEDVYPYMTDGSYIEVYEGTSPRKVRYTDAYHTAIATETPGVFISKWSAGPTVKHKKDACPFYKDNEDLKYYIKSSLFSINGNSTLITGDQTSFSLPYETKSPYWTVSSNLAIKSGQGTSSITVSAIAGGEGTISAYQGENLIATKKIQIYGLSADNINVQFSENNTLYAYHPNRNECRATYSGNVLILEYEWEATDWDIQPINSDKSKVRLIAKNPPLSTMTNIKVRARSADGWSQYKLFGCKVDNSMSIYTVKSIDNIIEIELKDKDKYYIKEATNTKYILQEQSTGNKIKQGYISHEGGTINVSDTPKGLYIITLSKEQGQKIQSNKIIIK